MATLTISMANSALATTNGSKAYTISDADITALVAWARVAYPPPLTNPPTPDNRTNAQVLLAWFQSYVNATRDSVKKFNDDAAKAAASGANITFA